MQKNVKKMEENCSWKSLREGEKKKHMDMKTKTKNAKNTTEKQTTHKPNETNEYTHKNKKTNR